MGQVWLARSTMMGGQVAAVKVLLKEVTQNTGVLARFDNEVCAIGAIKDPNVVRAYEAGVLDDGRRFLIMEFCDRGSLASLLEDKKRLPLQLALSIMLQAASALAAAHRLKIIHRDFKPGNILLEERAGRLIVKLGDFGIAKLLDDNLRAAGPKTQTSQLIGTVAYMAPEQVASGTAIDHRVDVYAWGVVFYECVTGQRPYHGAESTLFESIQNLASKKPVRPPSELRPDIPPELERVILGCLEHDRERRIESIDEAARQAAQALPVGQVLLRIMADNLARDVAPSAITVAEGLGVAASQLVSETPLASAPSPRGSSGARRLVAAWAAGALVGGMAMTLVTWRSASSEDRRANDLADQKLPVTIPPVVVPTDALTVARVNDAEATYTDAASGVIQEPNMHIVASPSSPSVPPKLTRSAAATPSRVLPAPASRAPAPRPPMTNDPAKVQTGVLVVRVKQTWAQVWIDQEEAGTTPVRTKVPAGLHKVLLVGARDREPVTVTVTAGGETVIERNW